MSNSPPSSVIAVSLPTGGKLLASATLKTVSSECSGAANLATQIAPLLASLSPQILVLKLLKPLIDIVLSLPNPSVTALQEFSKAANDMAPLLLAPTQGSLLPFVRDLILSRNQEPKLSAACLAGACDPNCHGACGSDCQ